MLVIGIFGCSKIVGKEKLGNLEVEGMGRREMWGRLRVYVCFGCIGLVCVWKLGV